MDEAQSYAAQLAIQEATQQAHDGGVKLAPGDLGIVRWGHDSVFKSEGTMCPIGCYVLGKKKDGEFDPYVFAARSLKVSSAWITGFWQGFDDAFSGSRLMKNKNQDDLLLGYVAGCNVAEHFMPKTKGA